MMAVGDEVKQAARVAKHSDTLEVLPRVGLVGFGVTHLVLAWIVAQIASGKPRHAHWTRRSALAQARAACHRALSAGPDQRGGDVYNPTLHPSSPGSSQIWS